MNESCSTELIPKVSKQSTARGSTGACVEKMVGANKCDDEGNKTKELKYEFFNTGDRLP